MSINLNPDSNKFIISQNKKDVSSDQITRTLIEQEVTNCFTCKIKPSFLTKEEEQSYSCLLPEFPSSPPSKTSALSNTAINAIKGRAKMIRIRQLHGDMSQPEMIRDPFMISGLDDNDTSAFVMRRGKKMTGSSNKRKVPSPASKTFYMDRAKKLRVKAFSPKESQGLNTPLDMFEQSSDMFEQSSSPIKSKQLTEESFSSPSKSRDLNDVSASTLTCGKAIIRPSLLSSESFNSPIKTKKGSSIFSLKFSPPGSGKISILPPTPLKSKKKQIEINPPFSNPLKTSTDATLQSVEKTSIFDPELVYQLEGVPHNLVKQAGNKSCGAATLLMLYTDIVRKKGIPFDLKTKFWNWYARATLTTAQNLCDASESHTNLSAHKLKLKSLLLPCREEHHLGKSVEMNISEIERHLKISDLPCILSITHPHIAGHWIVIDGINDKEVALRDPFAGEAYLISRSDLEKYFSDDPQYLIYCSVLSERKELQKD